MTDYALRAEAGSRLRPSVPVCDRSTPQFGARAYLPRIFALSAATTSRKTEPQSVRPRGGCECRRGRPHPERAGFASTSRATLRHAVTYWIIDAAAIEAGRGPHPAASPFDRRVGEALGLRAFELYQVELPPGQRPCFMTIWRTEPRTHTPSSAAARVGDRRRQRGARRARTLRGGDSGVGQAGTRWSERTRADCGLRLSRLPAHAMTRDIAGLARS